MYNNFYITVLFVFLTCCLNAQEARWVRTVQSEGYDNCHDMHVDSSGYVYVTGQIEFTASFSGGSNVTRSSYGQHDIFISKYDSIGNLLWAKNAGGTDGDIGYSIAVDHKGNSYIVGEFETTSYFGSLSKTVQSGSSNNMFLAKYDTAGKALWVKSIGTNSGSTIGWAVACDVNGNVYASGTTSSRATYNGSTLFSTRGSKDAIIIKFDTDGNYDWFKQIGGTESDECFGLVCDGAYLYATGTFEGNCKFSTSVTLNNTSGQDFFLAKYDTSGNFIWAKKGGGSGDDIGYDVSVNSNGEIVCTGQFQSTGTFGSNSVHSNGNLDMFIAAFNSSGTNLWVRSGGGSGADVGNKISHDHAGNLFVGGTFIYSADFDTLTVNSNGYYDAFLASYDSSGNLLDVKGFGGTGHEQGHGTGTDKYGNVYFCGDYWSDIAFDTININHDEKWDGFITRFGNFPLCTLTTTVSADASCYNLCNGSIDVIPDGPPPYTYFWPLFPSQHTGNLSNLCVGSYPVVVTNGSGCVSYDTAIISQPSPIIINAVTVHNLSCTGCSDGSIYISVSGGTGAHSYYWSDGSTSEDRVNLSSGTYSLCISDANNCILCDTFTVSGPLNGIFDPANSFVVEVFPNPAHSLAEIRTTNIPQNNKYYFEFFNSVGQLLQTIPVESEKITLLVEDYPGGVYYLKLIDRFTGEAGYIRRLLIQH